jgi:hypothetical protein
LFGLWLLGSGVHLYSLSYVYDFNMHWQLWAPAVWVLVWTAHLRAPDFLPMLALGWRRMLFAAPLLATFLAAAEPGNLVFPALTFLNASIYGSVCLRNRKNRFAPHLFLISLVALAGGLPEDWGRTLAAGFSQNKAIAIGAAVYVLIWSVRSRSPKLGLFGAFVASAAVMGVLGEQPAAYHWSAEAGLAFLLTHSLRWVDRENAGARRLRIVAAAAWMAHALIWMRCGGSTWMAGTIAGPVLGVYMLHRFIAGNWGSLLVPGSASLVILAGPGDFSVTQAQAAPVGLLALVGSFLLFGLGTLAALTKHRWLR